MIVLEINNLYLLSRNIEKTNRQIPKLNFLEFPVNLSNLVFLVGIEQVFSTHYASQLEHVRESHHSMRSNAHFHMSHG